MVTANYPLSGEKVSCWSDCSLVRRVFFEGLACHPLISSLNKMQVELFFFFLWPFNVFYPHFLTTSFPKPKRNNVTDWPVLFLDLIYAGVCERMTHRACFTLAARPRTKSLLKSWACREEGLHSPGRSAFSSTLSPGLYLVSKCASPPQALKLNLLQG